MPDESALFLVGLVVSGAVLVGVSGTQNSAATSPVVTGSPGTTRTSWVATVVPTGPATATSVVPTGVRTLAPDLAVRQKPTVDTHRRAFATVLPTVSPTELVSAPTVAVVPAPTVPVEPAHTVTVVPAPKVAVVPVPTAPPGMDTRFVYVSGAGITAAYPNWHRKGT